MVHPTVFEAIHPLKMQTGGTWESRRQVILKTHILSGSEPAQSEAQVLIARTLDGMDVVLSSVGRGLATSWSLIQWVLPYVDIAQGNQKIRGGEGPKLGYRSQKKKKNWASY
jgi:hypothetical protein